jgi:hypothetical protein
MIHIWIEIWWYKDLHLVSIAFLFRAHGTDAHHDLDALVLLGRHGRRNSKICEEI